jgi:queuine/archaeosine tRNA-ribosyltransferase
MIDETISQIEARLKNAGSLNEQAKRELAGLLATLKTEIEALSKTHADQAQSIAGFTQTSAHEALREETNPELLKLSLEGLATSVDGFEKSHPSLVQIVNRICTTLSNIGI